MKKTTSIVIDPDTATILKKYTMKLLERMDLGKLSFSRVVNLFIKSSVKLLAKVMNSKEDEVIEKIAEVTEI